MANPAPTINQINAFNATQGTIIDFNIIGGTELVRSNRIYIYDLSDNSLICTHLYVSTESIHELPANTDSSIIYESGKSSADFVNGAQYYAQIQTYTDTAGTEGGSGLSVAKMFWCLVDPTLTITTIPSTISTTSYNVSATYNANTSVVSNIIQQYQFNLYSATGSLLQSSGVVVGNGEQQGTSTAYDISYNFSGLSVGSSYYVAVDVTTTQGMNVSTQSNTFTVSIDTPTLGEATVVNNACDGYISVTSNLSGEYGGSASGEIASFVTSSVNDISSLKVTLTPIQDLHGYDKPWVGGAGKNLLDSEYALKFTTNRLVSLPKAISAGTTIYVHSDGFNYTTPPTSGVKYPYYVFRGANNENCGQVWGTADASVTLSTEAVAIQLWSNGYDYGASSGVEVTINGLTISLTEQTQWTPYTNICPISGWDEVEVVVSPTQSADDGTAYTTDLPQTVYGGTLDVVSGVLTVDRAMVDLGAVDYAMYSSGFSRARFRTTALETLIKKPPNNNTPVEAVSSIFDLVNWGTGNSTNVVGVFGVDTDGDLSVWLNASDYTDATAFKSAVSGQTLVYELATPTTIQCDPQTVQTLIGDNNVWGGGSVSITYNIPITNLLVKRQDVADVSGTWLTLHSQPITQASDMDFTFIDFLNQYGKTYKYALVPLLTQTQSGVEVEVEGGYTVSDEVQSVFDGVFIADSTGLQKCKANVGYGDVDMNQAVGTITPIGAKYPVVITNSKNQYHNGSISGTIVPDDYYFNGNLSRIDMVNKRNELEQFLTNKRAKIIKDWNSNIWLVMIMDNIDCSFDNNYGMGIVTFNANWLEVGDPTNQEDLQATGLVDVGGV